MDNQADSDSGRSQQPTWERDVLAKLASEALKEQRRSRRWSVFFRLAFLGYFVLGRSRYLFDYPFVHSTV